MTMRMHTNTAMTSTAAFAADTFSCARAAFNTAILLLDAAFAASIFLALLSLVLVSLLTLVLVSLLGLLNITLITLISLLAVLVVLLIPVRLKR